MLLDAKLCTVLCSAIANSKLCCAVAYHAVLCFAIKLCACACYKRSAMQRFKYTKLQCAAFCCKPSSIIMLLKLAMLLCRTFEGWARRSTVCAKARAHSGNIWSKRMAAMLRQWHQYTVGHVELCRSQVWLASPAAASEPVGKC